jgi:hypothetical protein
MGKAVDVNSPSQATAKAKKTTMIYIKSLYDRPHIFLKEYRLDLKVNTFS